MRTWAASRAALKLIFQQAEGVASAMYGLGLSRLRLKRAGKFCISKSFRLPAHAIHNGLSQKSDLTPLLAVQSGHLEEQGQGRWQRL